MRKPFRFIFNLNFLYLLLIAAQVAAIIFLCLYLPAVLPTVAAVAAVWLISALTALLLLSRSSSAEVKCAWFTVIAALPVAGAALYLLCAIRQRERGVLRVNGAAAAPPVAAAAAALCGTCEIGYDRARYFADGADFFHALLAEIESARSTVFIEFYIIGKGKIFGRTLDALARAAARGVEIRVILDGVGSAFKLGRRERKALRKIASVKTFHPLLPLPLSGLNLRDHRKIVTVDGRTAFTGGFNLSDEYANLTSPYGHWKDAGVAVYGPAAKVFEGMFLSMWEGEYAMDAPEGGKYRCLPFCDSPPRRTFCEDAFACMIDRAKHRIYAMTPYFCVSERLAAALAFAARRGVDVKILLPHIPDKKYVLALSHACAAALAESGVQFFAYTPGFMHAKCLLCDDQIVLGSYNLDFRSMHYNYECGVLFRGGPVRAAERDFAQCLALSAPLRTGKLTPLRRLSHILRRLFAPLV